MDPLLVLPPEVLLLVCALLSPADLARLGELSRGWRDFADDEALWKDVDLDLSDLFRPNPGLLRTLRRAPCLGSLTFSPYMAANVSSKFAFALSHMTPKVRSLKSVFCGELFLPLMLRRVAPYLEELVITDFDAMHLREISGMPALRSLSLDCHSWTLGGTEALALPLQLQYLKLGRGLKLHSTGSLAGLAALRRLHIVESTGDKATPWLPPQLEELRLDSASPDDLRAVQSAPALRRLCIEIDRSIVWEEVEIPPLPPGHCGLRWLWFKCFEPTETTTMLSLVRAHAATLEELVVGNADSCLNSSADPTALADQLGACGLVALRLLQLQRPGPVSYRRWLTYWCVEDRCSAQLQALRRVFAHLETVVVCRSCCEREPRDHGWEASSDRRHFFDVEEYDSDSDSDYKCPTDSDSSSSDSCSSSGSYSSGAEYF